MPFARTTPLVPALAILAWGWAGQDGITEVHVDAGTGAILGVEEEKE